MNTNKIRKNSPTLFFILVSLIFPAETALARITKGPFLLRAYQNRAAVMWETDTEGNGKPLYSADTTKKPNYVITKPQRVQYEIRRDPNNVVKKTAFIHKT
jgi:hypothetical protein